MTRTSHTGKRLRSATTIFRREAIDHHRHGDDAVYLPHYATLPVRAAMWSLILLVLVAAALALSTSVPRYASGRAVVVNSGDRPSVAVQLSIVVQLPSDERSQLHGGEPLTVTLDRSPEPVVTQISAVLPPGQSPGTGGCSLGSPQAQVGASAVTVVAPVPASAATVPERSVGSAVVETGRQSLLSWVAS